MTTTTRTLTALFAVCFLALPAQVRATIETVAGNYHPDGHPATAVPMTPRGITADSSGGFYVPDDAGFVYHVDAAGTVSIVAGTGRNGFGGDGGPAVAALLTQPRDVALDGADNLYIADAGNYRIRRVDAAGTITTVAGNGTSGFSGDDGPATSASLGYGFAIAVDGAGKLYVADYSNHRIRKVDATGTITTVAGDGQADFSGDGDPATDASLDSPLGVTVDGTGNLYIADTGNYRVRKVDSGGTITTVAGNGTAGSGGDGDLATSAGIGRPKAVAIDPAGNLYIGHGGRVRRVDAGGTISTVAGNGTFGFSGDGGPATSASLYEPLGVTVDGAGNLYFADTNYRRIRKVDAGGIINTVAGNGESYFFGDGGPAISARLGGPHGVTVDGAGNLYVVDRENRRIRRVDADGTITTVAGNGGYGFSGDGGLAVDASLGSPRGAAVDDAGNLYIADTNNHRIRKVDPGGAITTVAGDGTRGFFGDDGPAASARLGYPFDVAVDSAGNLYIADRSNRRIRRVDPEGIITTVAGNGFSGFSGDDGPATSARIRDPYGVAVDGAGNLYIADTFNHRIRRVGSTGTITTVAGSWIYRDFSGDGGPATSARLAWPHRVAVDGAGNLYIADSYNHRIRRVDSAGTITTVAGNGIYGFSGDGGSASDASLSVPWAVAVGGASNFFIADTTNHRVRRVTLNQPPACDSLPPAAAECGGATTAIGLDGSAASDPDGDALAFSWTTDCPGGGFDDDASATPVLSVASAPPGVSLPLDCSATLSVTDAGGFADTCVPTPVTVADTLAPAIEHLAASRDELWPPNHRMVEVTVSAVAADACDGAPACAIEAVSSDEPVDGTGDGDTAPDWQIVDGSTVLLRAERAGGGDGRVYAVSVACADAAGNTAVGEVTVSVPHHR